jgi:Tol biopolymer transport system component
MEAKPSSNRIHLYIVFGILVLALVLTYLSQRRASLPDFQLLDSGGPYIAYLAPSTPSESQTTNIWVDDLAFGPNENHVYTAQQVTFLVGEAGDGVYDFAVSADGGHIAYTQPESDSRDSDIVLLDLQTGAQRTLIDCVTRSCTAPAWHPSGDLLAYEETTYTVSEPGGPISNVTRVYIADLRGDSISLRPLFDDETRLSRAPRWSPDGLRISVYDPINEAIEVYNFEDDSSVAFANAFGDAGVFSPNSALLAFPTVVENVGPIPYTQWQIGDLTTRDTHPIPSTLNADADAANDDALAAWRPTSDEIALARLTLDNASQRQIVLVNAVTGEVQSVTTDADYGNSFMAWSADGTRLLIQRLPAGSLVSEVWLYDFERGSLEQVAANAYVPQWIEMQPTS